MTVPSADELEQILDGGRVIGWRVKSTDTHHLDVMVTTNRAMPQVYDRFWCYAGKAPAVLLTAVAAAFAWDGSDDTEPEGWSKNGQSQEWRGPA